MEPHSISHPEDLFLAHLPHIERVAAQACRRRGFSREETEDFVSIVKVKIFEDDYAVLRKFQGRSTLPTYLTVVIQRLFLDHLNHLWGKWRPCAEAERMGPMAVLLDRLLHRDGFTFEEACEILWTNHHVEASREELEEIASKLPPRATRHFEDEEILEDRPAEIADPEEGAMNRETQDRRREVLRLLREALSRLDPEDALISRMSGQFKVSQIARTLRLEQKPLYPRLERIHRDLRQDLEQHGVRPEEIDEILKAPEEEPEARGRFRWRRR